MYDYKNQEKQAPVQCKVNRTGLPDRLKAGIEYYGGYDMSHVKVHYNSAKPAQLQAHAYTQGNNIYVAPSQEKYLPHEAWHVVQQMDNRVAPTMQFAGFKVNGDKGLEREADMMGDKAMSFNEAGQCSRNSVRCAQTPTASPGITQHKSMKPTRKCTSDDSVAQLKLNISMWQTLQFGCPPEELEKVSKHTGEYLGLKSVIELNGDDKHFVLGSGTWSDLVEYIITGREDANIRELASSELKYQHLPYSRGIEFLILFASGMDQRNLETKEKNNAMQKASGVEESNKRLIKEKRDLSDKSEKQCEFLEKLKTELAETTGALRKTISDLNDEISSLKKKNIATENEKSQASIIFNNRIKELAATIDGLNNEVTALKGRNEELETEKNKANTSLSNAKNLLTRLKGEVMNQVRYLSYHYLTATQMILIYNEAVQAFDPKYNNPNNVAFYSMHQTENIFDFGVSIFVMHGMKNKMAHNILLLGTLLRAFGAISSEAAGTENFDKEYFDVTYPAGVALNFLGAVISSIGVYMESKTQRALIAETKEEIDRVVGGPETV